MKKVLQYTIAVTAMLMMSVSIVHAQLNTRIDGGYNHTLYLDTDDNVIAIGSGRYGETGPNAMPWRDTYYGMAPIHVGIKATNIAAGGFRSAALRHDGTVRWWGLGASSIVYQPTEVVGVTDAVDIAMTDDHLYIALNTGNVLMFNFDTAPVQVLGLSNIVEIAAGRQHVVARDNTGQVFTVGGNADGQLCDGTVGGSNLSPTLIGSGAVAIGAGSNTTFVILEDGTAQGCGSNQDGRVGNNSTATVTSLQPIAGLSDVKYITGGRSQSIAVTNAGDVYAWGWHNLIDGVCGYNIDHAPCQVTSLPENVIAVGAGGDHTETIDDTNVLRGWGGNLYGKLGNGDNQEKHNPVLAQLPLGVEFVEVLVIDPVVASVEPGGSYTISGENFGTEPGTVQVEGVPMTVTSWSDAEIHIENPTEDISGYLTVTTADGLESNPVWVDLVADAPTETPIVEEPVVEEPVVEEPVEQARDCRPGWGYGDKNHEHKGPPGIVGRDACDTRPGWGYGDKNHKHVGPPGLKNKESKGKVNKGKHKFK